MSVPFDPEAGEPGYLYQRFADYLATLITAGKLRPGARLPGERDLAMEHGVSIGTVRRATEVLRDRGLVMTLPAKGTYITPKGPHSADLESEEEPVDQIFAPRVT